MADNLALLAYSLLTDTSKPAYTFSIAYSKRFKPYNATATLKGKHITIRLSHTWKDVDPSITIGVIQHLLTRLLKIKKKTLNIELYESFIKNLDKQEKPVEESDPRLVKLFDEINATFFNSLLTRPRLIWKGTSTRTLAVYEYHTDTIRISTIFKHAPDHLLKFLIYHESLHKFLKFEEKHGKTYHHTKRFRALESLYPNHEQIERELGAYITAYTRRARAAQSAAYTNKLYK